MRLFTVLQEESSVKPEKAGLRSRFAPSIEDLTSASKQVQSPKVVSWFQAIKSLLGRGGSFRWANNC